MLARIPNKIDTYSGAQRLGKIHGIGMIIVQNFQVLTEMKCLGSLPLDIIFKSIKFRGLLSLLSF